MAPELAPARADLARRSEHPEEGEEPGAEGREGAPSRRRGEERVGDEQLERERAVVWEYGVITKI